jgi:membrane protein YdbS with pleckstrin-like domain
MNAALRQLLRIPAEPALPPGSSDSVRVFRAATNFYRLLLFHWVGAQVSAVIGIIVSLSILRGISQDWSESIRFWVHAAEFAGIAFYLVQLPFTLWKVRLDYELRWYIVTDRSLRIRTGVVHIREMTLTFANIQHLAVHQGPLQRMLGIYDLRVRTAGGGGVEPESQQAGSGSSVTHVGHFRGVENAPAIRDLILERIREARDAGLGDTDDLPQAEPGNEGGVARRAAFRAAVSDVRTEIAGLHRALGS